MKVIINRELVANKLLKLVVETRGGDILPDFLEVDAEPVEPDATSGEKVGWVCRADNHARCLFIRCACPCHLKQAPNDHRMPQDKSSDEILEEYPCCCRKSGNFSEKYNFHTKDTCGWVDRKLPEKLKIGDRVFKIKGSNWQGKIVGTYSTELTPEGYVVESEFEKGSVQIYPAHALELVALQKEG